jgi:hypothetical protein
MLDDQIWAASGLRGDGGMLCLRCLERPLGQELAPSEFMDATLAVPSAWDTFRRDEPHYFSRDERQLCLPLMLRRVVKEQ